MFSITAWNNEKSSVWTLSSLRSGLKKSLCGKGLSTPRFPQERRGAALGRTLCTQPLPLCACWVLMPRALGPPCGVLSFTSVSSVQSLSRVRLFATPWTAARQASLSISNSWSFLKLMSVESVMPSNKEYWPSEFYSLHLIHFLNLSKLTTNLIVPIPNSR